MTGGVCCSKFLLENCYLNDMQNEPKNYVYSIGSYQIHILTCLFSFNFVLKKFSALLWWWWWWWWRLLCRHHHHRHILTTVGDMYKPLSSSTNYRLSQWLITDVNSVLGLLPHVVVSDIAYFSSVHANSTFWVDPEDGDSRYFWNVSTIAYSHMVWQPKNRINTMKFFVMHILPSEYDVMYHIM